MSLHVHMTDEAEKKLRTEKRKRIFTATLTAVLGGALLITLLYIAAVVIAPIVHDPIVGHTPEPPTSEVEKQQRPVMTTTRPIPTPTETYQTDMVTTDTPSPTEIHTTEIDNSAKEISTVLIDDNGLSFGGETGTEGVISNPIGQESGNGLEGTLYDLKQTQSGKLTNITPNEAAALMKEFVTKKWNANLFNKYYAAPTKLYNSMFYISRRKATEAPKAFKCEDRVKDSLWCAVYRGKVTAPKDGKFRFVGGGDDGITVRFNNTLVFDYGWYILSLGKKIGGGKNSPWYQTLIGKSNDKDKKKELADAGVNIPPVTFYEYSGSKYWNNNIGGLAAGKVFEVKKGETYPIEVLITEIPGGEFGVALLIEDMDVPPSKKDAKTGAPIFPLFRTSYQIPDSNNIKGLGGDYIPFDEVGTVWDTAQ